MGWRPKIWNLIQEVLTDDKRVKVEGTFTLPDEVSVEIKEGTSVAIDQSTDGVTNKVQARNSVHDAFNVNANLQVNDIDATAANPVPISLAEETTKVIGTVNANTADGSNVTIGAKTDAPATTGTVDSWSVIAMLKGIYNKLGAVVLGAGSSIIGKVEIDQVTANANEVVTKTGSVTTGQAKSTYGTTALAASGVIKAAAGTLYGVAGVNDSASDQYLQILGSAVVPANGAIPIIVLEIPAKSNFSIDFGMYGYSIGTGISWSNSSTLATKTIGSADVWLNAIYS